MVDSKAGTWREEMAEAVDLMAPRKQSKEEPRTEYTLLINSAVSSATDGSTGETSAL